MITVYISHSRHDSAAAGSLAGALREKGMDVSRSVSSVTPGQNWKDVLGQDLRTADLIIALVTENARSDRVIDEFVAARVFTERRNDQARIIPVVMGNCEVPRILKDIEGIYEDSIDSAAASVLNSVERFVENAEQEKRQRKISREQLEQNAPEYINETIDDLRDREKRDRRGAVFCYILGFAALLCGLYYTMAISKQMFDETNSEGREYLWSMWALYTTKSAIVIGLAVALSKYAFSLGKSFMGEGLKNSDRRHAISFGRFYIKAYGEDVTYEEIKDVFQHWNIAREPTFASLDGKDFDPNFVAHVVEVAKVLRTHEAKEPKEGK